MSGRWSRLVHELTTLASASFETLCSTLYVLVIAWPDSNSLSSVYVYI